MRVSKVPPVPRGEEDRWFHAAMNGGFLYQRCADCGEVPTYPRALCPSCWGESLVEKISAGLGTVYSFTTQHRPGGPGFEENVPYTLVLVDLDEGVRVLADLRDCPDECLRVGLRVEVRDDRAGTGDLPGFRPVAVT